MPTPRLSQMGPSGSVLLMSPLLVPWEVTRSVGLCSRSLAASTSQLTVSSHPCWPTLISHVCPRLPVTPLLWFRNTDSGLREVAPGWREPTGPKALPVGDQEKGGNLKALR